MSYYFMTEFVIHYKVKHLDAFTGKRKRHIFFGFMRVFRMYLVPLLFANLITWYLGTDYMIMTFLIVLRVWLIPCTRTVILISSQVISTIAAPVGVSQLLQ